MRGPLYVFLEGKPAGFLVVDSTGEFTFQYDAQYVADEESTPLSLTMPVAASSYRGQNVQRWVDNLLPDSSRLRDRLAKKFGERSASTYSLLRHVGLDAAGAVQITPETSLPQRPAGLRVWTSQQIADEVTRLREDPSAIDMTLEIGRWSLAGAQGKFALAWNGSQWCEPFGDSPSTHIFKMGVQGIDGSDLIEFVTMRAAAILGLRVPSVNLATFEGVPVVIVERFDRRMVDGQMTRVHQEDFCQALGFAGQDKYQDEGGPGLSEIVRVLEESHRVPGTLVDRFRSELVDWQAFNFVTGSTDGHAKNLSVLHRSGTTVLAPAYDLLATSLAPMFPRDDVYHTGKLAMKVGGRYAFKRIGVSSMERESELLGLPPQAFRIACQEMYQKVGSAFERAFDDAESVLGSSAVVEEMRSKFRRWLYMIGRGLR